MAALTWRDVAAPSFGGAADSFRTGATLQQNALSSIGDALKGFRAEQDNTLNNQILAKALQVNDPKAYQQALTDGTFLAGVDPSRVNPQVLSALGSRAGSLLSQAATEQNMGRQAYAQGRTEQLDQIQDNSRAASARALGITDASLAALSPEQQRAAALAPLQLEGAVLGNEGRRIGNQAGRFGNMVRERDDGVNQVAINTADSIRRNSASPEDALAELEQMNDLQPAERAAAYERLATDFGRFYANGGAAAPSGAPGGRGGKPGTAAGSPYDTTFNFQGTSTPITSQPISAVLQGQAASQKTQGHSPMGAFQINKATLEDYGPKVLGKDWQNQDFTPENQEKIAKAIFDDRKGGDLSKTWSSLPNASPGAYKDLSWQEMRSILSQGEVGQHLPSDPASLRLLSQQSQFEASRRAAQNDSVGVTADVARNLNEHRSAPELVQEVVKTQFPGADVGKLTGIVNKAQRDNPGLSAADVLSAVSRSTRNASTFNPLSSGWAGTTEFAPGVGIDDEAFQANIQSIKDGKADYLSNSNQLTRKQAGDVATAQSNYDTAMQNLMSLSARQQIQPGISTERAEAAFEKAEAALKRALSKQHANPNYRPVRQ